MKKHGWIDSDGAAEPEPQRRGSYPPDIARRRRQLGLPVTPEEHVVYARGETREPPVTALEMARALRDVSPRSAALFLQALRQIARQSREPGEDG